MGQDLWTSVQAAISGAVVSFTTWKVTQTVMSRRLKRLEVQQQATLTLLVQVALKLGLERELVEALRGVNAP